ncbi:MAG: response regulator [Oscillospiraceae bacterium]|nr:response regulator [Oscillospiraceae bacterium]
MRKLLIAESSQENADVLAAEFGKEYEISTFRDGQALLKYLRQNSPEILILDLSLPVVDGLEVLKQTQDCLPPVILAIASFPSDYVIGKAFSLGVGHVVVRTCSIRAIREPLEELVWMAEHPDHRRKSPQRLTLRHLEILGLTPGSEGFHQIRTGIPMLVQDPAMALGKELYPQICQRLGSGDSRTAEHNIRKCVHDAWVKGDRELWVSYFPECQEKAPTNREFLCRLALIVEQEMRAQSVVRPMENYAVTLGK